MTNYPPIPKGKTELICFMEALSSDNLCAFFILPMIGMDFNTLRGNYYETYLSPEGDKIIIRVVIASMVRKEHSDLQEHECIIVQPREEYIRFTIPERWLPDVQLFMLGKYSKMSEEAKQLIKDKSSLRWNFYNKRTDKFVTDFRLLALDRSEILRKKWERLLFDEDNPGVLDEEMELLSPPSERSFLVLPTT